jgi:hypothetical protein
MILFTLSQPHWGVNLLGFAQLRKITGEFISFFGKNSLLFMAIRNTSLY